MNIVIDTNVLISALIKDSTTRKILIEAEWTFYYPKISFHEIEEHQEVILEKSGLDPADYYSLLVLLLKRVQLLSTERFQSYLAEAQSFLGQRDPDDVVFLAAALSLPQAVIWSDDTDFDLPTPVRTLKTADIVQLFYDLS